MKSPLSYTAALIVLTGCSADDKISESAGDALYADDAGDMLAPRSDNGGESESADDYEPEVEDDLLGLKPATTPEYVFVANPERNTVTRIAVPGLTVTTAQQSASTSTPTTSASSTPIRSRSRRSLYAQVATKW
jgi:hypothetical protein